jgi:squalene-associated FAD-dependent desaturase
VSKPFTGGAGASGRKVAIVGGGWAGLAAAIYATQAGHSATVLEASRTLGGRARALKHAQPGGKELTLDNGQHILIGAYSDTLALLRTVGVNPADAFLRLPLTLRFPDGTGLQCPPWRAPFDALAGIITARGWSWRDKTQLLRASLRWQREGFQCAASLSVAELCAALTPRVMAELIEPLCASALNTAAQHASAQVFLRVLKDSLFGGLGSSNFLIPRLDLGQLFPEPAAAWLANHGTPVHTGCRVQSLAKVEASTGNGWELCWQQHGNDFGQTFDEVILACPSWEAARIARTAAKPLVAHDLTPGCPAAAAWLGAAEGLTFEAITTVYASSATRLREPILALRSTAEAPAQFVFDRRFFGQASSGAEANVLAFVVSVSQGEREHIEQQVLAQGQAQLGLHDLQPIQTVVEKRATFACTPGLQRPAARIAPGLLACGEYVAGPYPGTLEGAVRSAYAAVQQLGR